MSYFSIFPAKSATRNNKTTTEAIAKIDNTKASIDRIVTISVNL